MYMTSWQYSSLDDIKSIRQNLRLRNFCILCCLVLTECVKYLYRLVCFITAAWPTHTATSW